MLGEDIISFDFLYPNALVLVWFSGAQLIINTRIESKILAISFYSDIIVYRPLSSPSLSCSEFKFCGRDTHVNLIWTNEAFFLFVGSGDALNLSCFQLFV